jgi:tetratricopeptide (TPR) repeat protein
VANDYGHILHDQGRIALSCEQYAAILDVARRTEQPTWIGISLYHLASRLSDFGRLAEAEELLSEAHALFAQDSDTRLLSYARSLASEMALIHGNAPVALTEALAALKLVESSGYIDAKMNALGVLGTAQRANGQYEAALEQHHRVMAHHTAQADRVAQIGCCGTLAQDYLTAARFGEAQPLVSKYLAEARACGMRAHEGLALALLAELTLATGDRSRALQGGATLWLYSTKSGCVSAGPSMPGVSASASSPMDTSMKV